MCQKKNCVQTKRIDCHRQLIQNRIARQKPRCQSSWRPEFVQSVKSLGERNPSTTKLSKLIKRKKRTTKSEKRTECCEDYHSPTNLTISYLRRILSTPRKHQKAKQIFSKVEKTETQKKEFWILKKTRMDGEKKEYLTKKQLRNAS